MAEHFLWKIPFGPLHGQITYTACIKGAPVCIQDPFVAVLWANFPDISAARTCGRL